ncbi:energy-coupling factor transporter transmembrane component T family protein [Halarcobacter anaerophilus]|uniref:Cobalt ABC transporter permease n=1 Tax=Halarcobacter anaerophilus TaxID=877500 RepID=A0A4Q0XYV5_9BACT|nr:energy-coupling factor transporter transmembrane component T [Halarcobacter anaerophilus]QDF29908.1 cobalt/nickel ECF transporter CbiMNQO, T component CbiQ [Halarcobacter anaerophilus]RXJ62870.1 cobalt ABC transporter permease [Halarcobacter anaerophilus]
MSRFNSSIILISALLYSIIVSFNKAELLFLLPIIFAAFYEYKNILTILKKLFFLNFFIGMLFVFLILQGDVQNGINIYIRTNMIILFNLLLFSKSSGYDIVRALNELKFPKEFVSSVYFSLKMIQTLTDEFKKIKQTLRARGFRANSSLFAYETYGNLFGHIFVKSIKKAQALQDSFKLRGFNGKIYLISSSSLSLHDVGLIFLVCVLYVKEVVV